MKLPILPVVLLASSLVCPIGAMPARAQTPQRVSIDLALTANPDDYRKENDLGSRSTSLHGDVVARSAAPCSRAFLGEFIDDAMNEIPLTCPGWVSAPPAGRRKGVSVNIPDDNSPW